MSANHAVLFFAGVWVFLTAFMQEIEHRIILMVMVLTALATLMWHTP